MLKNILLLFLCIPLLSNTTGGDFLNYQMGFSRVRNAEMEKGGLVASKLMQYGLDPQRPKIFLRGFKMEQRLELWASDNWGTYYKIDEYSFCDWSGELGPKSKQGDLQIPEGFYTINRFNPRSNFHLSLGLDYPNEADKKRSKHSKLGGDIFIHGNCITVGCISISDFYIKELYLFAMKAHAAGQEDIPVHIFPCDFFQRGSTLEYDYRDNPELLAYWENLEQGYRKFEETHQVPFVGIDSNGKYYFY